MWPCQGYPRISFLMLHKSCNSVIERLRQRRPGPPDKGGFAFGIFCYLKFYQKSQLWTIPSKGENLIISYSRSFSFTSLYTSIVLPFLLKHFSPLKLDQAAKLFPFVHSQVLWRLWHGIHGPGGGQRYLTLLQGSPNLGFLDLKLASALYTTPWLPWYTKMTLKYKKSEIMLGVGWYLSPHFIRFDFLCH